jgi:hypothetical protein
MTAGIPAGAARALAPIGRGGASLLPGMRSIRVKRGVVRNRMARHLGMHPVTLWRIEMCQQAARPETAARLADYLHTSVEALRTYPNPSEPPPVVRRGPVKKNNMPWP